MVNLILASIGGICSKSLGFFKVCIFHDFHAQGRTHVGRTVKVKGSNPHVPHFVKRERSQILSYSQYSRLNLRYNKHLFCNLCCKRNVGGRSHIGLRVCGGGRLSQHSLSQDMHASFACYMCLPSHHSPVLPLLPGIPTPFHPTCKSAETTESTPYATCPACGQASRRLLRIFTITYFSGMGMGKAFLIEVAATSPTLRFLCSPTCSMFAISSCVAFFRSSAVW